MISKDGDGLTVRRSDFDHPPRAVFLVSEKDTSKVAKT